MPDLQTEIILRHGEAELARLTLPPGQYVIGRQPGVDIHAETPLLSRQHARLTIREDQLVIEDLGSSNGTFVNDQPIHEATPLSPHQPLRLGDVAIEIRRSAPGLGATILNLTPAEAAIQRLLPADMLAEKRYAIGAQIARGGMGAILDARQRAIDRTVAMKVMLGADDETDVRRFIDEAKITGQLDHPNIVPIYELGLDERGQLFYTMKMVRGITLKKVLALLTDGVAATVKKYPLPARLTIFQKACDAMAFAHSKGVIHRDLKPENIMLGDFGEVLVMDWGLAKQLGGAPSARTSASPAPAHATALSPEDEIAAASRTLDGTIMGTPAYMSPEQARGEIDALDARSDIYALGAILFELLHLRPAVTGRKAMEIVSKVQQGAVEWNTPSQTNGSPVPESLLAVVRKAMAPEPAHRYPRVEDLQADLLAYQNGFATSAENASAWRQLGLLIRRHKATAIGLAAVFAVGTAFGTKAVIEGRRAEREAVRATKALADLKASAPALRQLAEGEATDLKFPDALLHLDAAIALDPDYAPAYWRRVWLFVGMERFGEAVDAFRLATRRDPGNKTHAKILPTLETLATSKLSESDTVHSSPVELARYLRAIGAHAELAALSRKLSLDRQAQLQLVRDRIRAWLPGDKPIIESVAGGEIHVRNFPETVTEIDALRGLPIRSLNLSNIPIASVEPLRGMSTLRSLDIEGTRVKDLTPLAGLPLEHLVLDHIGTSANATVDLSPLKGMPLQTLRAFEFRDAFRNYSALRGAPLRHVVLNKSGAADFSFLAEAPLESISLSDPRDLSALRGKPLRKCELHNGVFDDLTPLRGAPITELRLSRCPNVRDLRPLLELKQLEKLILYDNKAPLSPLRQHPSLQRIEIRDLPDKSAPALPVAAFWADYDARLAQRRQAARETMKLLVEAAKRSGQEALEIDCSKRDLPTLDDLKGLNFRKLIASDNPLEDLSSLAGSPLEDLSVTRTFVSDVSPLRGLPLKSLYLAFTGVSDLAPLRGAKLERLNVDETPVRDLRPLLEMPALRNVMIPRKATNIELLKNHPTLERIGWEGDWEGSGGTGRPGLTAQQFWARWDTLKETSKK